MEAHIEVQRVSHNIIGAFRERCEQVDTAKGEGSNLVIILTSSDIILQFVHLRLAPLL